MSPETVLISQLKVQPCKLKKLLKNYCLRVWSISWKFPTIYSFAVICPWNLRSLFLETSSLLITVSLVLSVCKQSTTVKQLTNYTLLKSQIFKVSFAYRRELPDKFSHLHGCLSEAKQNYFWKLTNTTD